jgi:hypothetical protein
MPARSSFLLLTLVQITDSIVRFDLSTRGAVNYSGDDIVGISIYPLSHTNFPDIVGEWSGFRVRTADSPGALRRGERPFALSS